MVQSTYSDKHSRLSEVIICTRLKDVDLGLIGDASLQYLAHILGSAHHLQNISFGEGNL
jgi:hypothetical protein